MTSPNVRLIEGLYAAFARGDVGSVLGVMDAGVVWNEAEGNAYADRNPYVGPEAVVAGVFARLGGEWDGFAVTAQEILDAGDTIVALGRYKGSFKTTGKPIDAQMVHVWRIKDGKIVGFQQYVDTLQMARAMGA